MAAHWALGSLPPSGPPMPPSTLMPCHYTSLYYSECDTYIYWIVRYRNIIIELVNENTLLLAAFHVYAYGIWHIAYEIYDMYGSSSPSDFWLMDLIFFLDILGWSEVSFTNVMAFRSSSHHHSSIWCPPNQLLATHHIFSSHNFPNSMISKVYMFQLR